MFVLMGKMLPVWVVALILIVQLILVHVVTIGYRHRHIVRAVCYTVAVGIFLLCPTTGSYYQYNLVWVSSSYTRQHLLQNIIIFLPLAYYWQLTIRSNWCIVILILFGIAIELLQLLIPGRVCDIMDIAGNGIGSILGVALQWLLQARRKI